MFSNLKSKINSISSKNEFRTTEIKAPFQSTGLRNKRKQKKIKGNQIHKRKSHSWNVFNNPKYQEKTAWSKRKSTSVWSHFGESEVAQFKAPRRQAGHKKFWEALVVWRCPAFLSGSHEVSWKVRSRIHVRLWFWAQLHLVKADFLLFS